MKTSFEIKALKELLARSNDMPDLEKKRIIVGVIARLETLIEEVQGLETVVKGMTDFENFLEQVHGNPYRSINSEVL